MARWRQKIMPDGTSKFVPVDEAARRQDGHFVQGDITSFVSPLDGSVITDRKQYREHCEKHGVVPAGEFNQEFYDRKAEERARHYQGEVQERKQEIRQEIYDNMIRAEREAGW